MRSRHMFPISYRLEILNQGKAYQVTFFGKFGNIWGAANWPIIPKKPQNSTNGIKGGLAEYLTNQ